MKKMIILAMLISSNAFTAPNYFTRSADTDFDHSPQGVVVGNFTGSSNLDAFVVFPSQNVISQMSLSFNGTYALIAEPYTSAVATAYDLIAADFNKDSHLDIYYYSTAGSSKLLTYQNVSNGKVSFISSDVTSDRNSDIGGADFNGDGNLDIAELYDTSMVVLSGDGAGLFPTGGEESNVVALSKLTIADFSSDNFPDVAVTTNSNKLFIYAGRAGASSVPYPKITTLDLGQNPQGLKAAKLDNNNSNDLIVANHDDNTLSILLNDGTGTSFTASTLPVCTNATPASSGPYNLVIADFNNDQINDVAVICNASGAENLGVLQIYAGHANHDGGFETTPMFSQNLGTNPYDIVSDDFNADGRPDLLISVPGANKIVTLLGNKEPSLSAASVNSNSGVFQITYTDADNEAPVGGVNLILDGTSIAMSEVDTSDITYSGAGKVYTSTQTLTVGNHSYRFSANDGTYDAISSDENLAPVSTSQTLTINPPASSGGGCSLSASASPLSLITWAASILLLGVLRNLFRFKKM